MKSATRSASSPFVDSDQAFGTLPIGGLAKRSFDMTAAACALILFSPLFLMIMALVKLTDKGPAFYGHSRIGHNGRIFKCLKFRTMATDGDELLRNYLRYNPHAAEEWRLTRKLKDDPRVTSVGKVLRKLSLDELPQLLNIVRGEMSVVGPRPVVDEELKVYDAFAVYYLRTRPGLTGLWQISGRNDVGYRRRVAMDSLMARRMSPRLYARVLVGTARSVLTGRGAY